MLDCILPEEHRLVDFNDSSSAGSTPEHLKGARNSRTSSLTLRTGPKDLERGALWLKLLLPADLRLDECNLVVHEFGYLPTL